MSGIKNNNVKSYPCLGIFYTDTKDDFSKENFFIEL